MLSREESKASAAFGNRASAMSKHSSGGMNYVVSSEREEKVTVHKVHVDHSSAASFADKQSEEEMM